MNGPEHYVVFRISAALHIGVHKTATTHLQLMLRLNWDALERSDVQYYSPVFLRQPGQHIEDMLLGADATERAEALAGAKTRLFLSEENYIGAFHAPSGNLHEPLYPMAPERVARLAAALAPVPLDVFLAIRHPADWISSCYSQLLLGDNYVSPAMYFMDNSPGQMDWVDLVARLRAAHPVRNIGVWRYEDYPANAPLVMRTMLRRRIGALLVPPPDYSNRGLSVAAVDAALAAGTPGAALRAREEFPIGETYPKFSPVMDDLRADIDQDYARQCQAIAAIPGVQLIGH